MINIETNAIVNSRNLGAVMYDRTLIKALAVQLVGSQVEALVDLLVDARDEYPAFGDVNNIVTGSVKESTKDYLEDLLAEFREALLAAVDEVQVVVENASFNKEGFVDANITVK